jgi:hypothetical protein
MGRVINTNDPGKRRSHFMRTVAEILRLLAQKRDVDDEVKDMLATIVFRLRDVYATIEESVQAWEKRNYWKKADDFQDKWYWIMPINQQITRVLKEERWEELPTIIAKLLPHFSDIEINKSMRDASDWAGNYERFTQEQS